MQNPGNELTSTCYTFGGELRTSRRETSGLARHHEWNATPSGFAAGDLRMNTFALIPPPAHAHLPDTSRRLIHSRFSVMPILFQVKQRQGKVRNVLRRILDVRIFGYSDGGLCISLGEREGRGQRPYATGLRSMVTVVFCDRPMKTLPSTRQLCRVPSDMLPEFGPQVITDV